METALLLNTSMLLTLMIILTPMLFPLLSKNFQNFPTTIKHTVKATFLISLTPLMLFIQSGMESITSHWEWKFMMNFKIPLNFKMAQYSMMFFRIALFVTRSILQFASWYMASEPHITKFFSHLLMFLVAMLMLTIVNNMFLLFIGWEGVEIM